MATSLAACGAREAQLVAETSPLDDRLSCEHLQGERVTNSARVSELAAETGRRQGDNVALVLGLGLAGAMMMDSGETQRQETEALQRRNARLDALLAERRCAR